MRNDECNQHLFLFQYTQSVVSSNLLPFNIISAPGIRDIPIDKSWKNFKASVDVNQKFEFVTSSHMRCTANLLWHGHIAALMISMEL